MFRNVMVWRIKDTLDLFCVQGWQQCSADGSHLREEASGCLRKWTSCCTKGNLIAESRTKPLLEHIYWDRWWGSLGSTWEAAPCWSFENNAGLPIGFTFQGHFVYSLLDSLMLLHYTVSHGYLLLFIYLRLWPDYFYTTSNIFLNIYYCLMDILDKVRWLWSYQVEEKEEDHAEDPWMEWRRTCRWCVLKRWSAVLAPKRSSWKQKNQLHWHVL